MAGAPKENTNAEKWKSHKDYPNYLVSDNGDIYSTISNKYMKLHADGHGYLRTDLRGVNGVKTVKAHRLVGLLFLDNNDNKPCLNHIDGIKRNNNVNNLEWCTYSENNKHAYDLELNNHGEKHSNSKLKNNQIDTIKTERSKGIKFKDLAIKYNVSISTIYRVVNEKRYSRI